MVIGVFGLALVASGVFPMDPMRGYPPGTPDATPATFSMRHRLHDWAGIIVFTSVPAAAAIAAFTLPAPMWQWWSGIACAGATAGFISFGQAWEKDSPSAGVTQKATIILGWIWLATLFAYMATR